MSPNPTDENANRIGPNMVIIPSQPNPNFLRGLRNVNQL
jgi:hypothetical protein